MNKFIAYILLTPLVWYIGSILIYNMLASQESHNKKIGASIIGVFIVLSLWATFFLF